MLNRMSLKGTVIKNGEILKSTVEFTEVFSFHNETYRVENKQIAGYFFLFLHRFQRISFCFKYEPSWYILH